MSIARSLLLRASRSTRVAEIFRRHAFARRAVRRFMPGEDAGAALDAAGSLAGSGLSAVITALGERVNSAAEVERVVADYLSLLDQIRSRALPANISVKLTHLGLDLDQEACTRAVITLCARAALTGSFVWIDIEESHYVDATLDVFRRVRGQYPGVGVCLQAYLKRTPADLASLLPLRPAIRLVKGAYQEPPDVAFAQKSDTDAAYIELSTTLLRHAGEKGAFPVFGTHDLKIVGTIRDTARALGLRRGGYEIHMLYGIKNGEQVALAKDGVAVRVLISYGVNWFPWYMRRLAERPANVWFVLRNLVP
jgi:proline dehydrogenase